MATTSKYFFLTPTADNLNFMDFDLGYGSLSLDGQEIRFTGSLRVDSVYVRPGLTYDLSSLGGGADKIYLTGNLADYTASVNTGITELTLQRSVNGKNETVKISGGSGVQFDNLVFANGTVQSNQLYVAVRDNSTRPAPSGETSVAPVGAAAAGASLNATIKAFALDATGETFALSRPGVNFIVNGNSGVDRIYVSSGATVDATQTGGSADFIYLRGNWADYAKALINGGSQIRFTRDVEGHTETVTVTAGGVNTADKLVFADGSVNTFNAKSAITATPNTGGAITAVSGYDAGTTTPGIAHAVTTVNVSTAPNLSGQSVISGKALANASVTVTIDPDNNAATSNSFTYAVTADANGDYSLNLATATPASGTPSFVAGTASVSVAQAVPGGASPATVITLPVSTTTTYSASIASDHVTEGGNAVFTVTRSGDTSGAGTVVYATQNGTAGAPGDYTSAGATLSFAAGETTKTVTVTTIDDANVEGNETLSLVLSNPTGGNLGTASATATLVDNEGALFSIDGTATGVSFSEGVGTYTFTVHRSGLTTGAATVVVSSGGGTATPGSAGSNDYNAVNQTLSFAAGETSKTVTVTINEDAAVEGNETFKLQLSSPSAGALVDPANASVTATILDNEAAVISMDNAAVGMSFSEGVGSVTFSLTRSGDTSSAVTVVVQSAGGTAGSNDYNAVNQTISFAAGETAKTVTVTINEDATVEGNETFNLQLSSPSAGALIDAGKASITATIQDNEAAVIGLDNAATGVSFSEGVGTVTFGVTRSGDTSSAVTVVVQSAGGTAGSNDYNAVNQTISFAAGETTKTVTVTINEDATVEGNETFNLQLSSPSAGALIDAGKASITATIQDNEAAVISMDNAATGVSFSEGVGTVTFGVTRSGDTSSAVTVVVQSAGGSAGSNDYNAVNQTISFAAGETSKTITITINDDALLEGNESFNLQLSSPSAGAVIASGSAAITATIQDNDQPVWSVASTGNIGEDAGALSYTVTRTGAINTAETIQFATAGGSATAGADYTAVNQVLSFAIGETSKTVTVAVNDDTDAEGNESVAAAISHASAGTIATATATGTIRDNEEPVWSVGGGGITSEDAGSLIYTVTRTGTVNTAATIQFATAGGTATAGADYTAVNQVLSFAIGEASKTVTVAVNDDANAEDNETVVAAISNASSGSINTNAVVGTIQDNDQSVWSVASVGNAGEGAGFLTYTVTRTGAVNTAATIQFATAGGTASAGNDYTAVNQVLSFAIGETSKTVTVAVIDDASAEGNETVVAAISNASAGSINTATASATILDNDQSLWSVASAGSVDEGAGFLTYTVTRTGATNTAATIQFAAAGGTAMAGSDYTAVNQVLSFAAGETSKTVMVAVNDDASAEGNETVLAVISNASAGTIAAATASASILDNDQSIWGGAGGGTVDEGAGFVTYTIVRTGGTAAATIEFATAGGTATAGSDYTAVHQTLSFAAGEMRKVVTVAINDDANAEDSETIVGVLSNASSGTIADPLTTGTILDNDQAVWSVAGGGNVDEGAGFLTYTVTRTGAINTAATIQFATAGGTASAGNDYTAVNQVLSFAIGETSKTVTVAVIDDASAEGNETVVAAISNASAGSINTATASATILDNDQSLWSVASAGSVDEGAGFLTYTVTRTGATNTAATIQFAAAGGTAMAGSDYTAVNQVLSFAAGETSKTVMVAVNDDASAEGNETVLAVISNASAGTIAAATASASILDNDQSIWGGAGGGTVDEGAGFVTYTIVRTGGTAAATIEFATAGGTATAGSDYTAVHQTLSFAAGETRKVVTVAINDDANAEVNETILGVLSNASSGSIGDASTNVIILDNDHSVWSVANAGNVDEGAGFLTYTVTRTGATAAATIQFATTSGTATAGSDYTGVTGQTLSFAAGETSKTIKVAVIDDASAEGNENVVARISNASSGFINTATSSATILDNDQSLWTVASAANADEGSSFLIYTITRTGATNTAATIQFATTGGTATAGSDYTAVSQTLSFAAGETGKTVLVALVDDAQPEGSETVISTISSASTGGIATATATATIWDNELASWSVSGANLSEGAGFISYVVSRAGAMGTAATVQFDTVDGSAKVGDGDYTAVHQTLSFAAGEIFKTVLVAVTDDALAESSETVIGSLSNASAGSITTATASASITDNDTVSWSVSAATVSEGAGFISYTVSRSGATGTAATIQFDTANGSAKAGSDYTAVTGQTLSFAAGESGKTVQVAVTDDAQAEGSETVIGFLSNASAGGIATATASASITDNDQSTWSVSSADVSENAGFISYTVSRTGATGAAATIQFDTAGGTATAGSDYTAITGQTLSFAAGEASKTVLVAVIDDAIAEGGEAVGAAISNASAGGIAVATASATILDNDPSMVWSVASAGNVSESAGFLSYTVTRAGATYTAATIQFAAIDGTAAAGSDYTAVSQTLSFAAGETSKTVQVAVIDDALVEGSETVTGYLSGASAGSITTATASASITDNDTRSWTVSTADVNEGAGFISYTVSRTGGTGAAATIQFDTANGSAKAGSDYTAVTGQTLSFAAGETSKTVQVAVIDDALAEGSETVFASLSNASTGSIATATASASITDNDTTTWSVSTATVSEDAGFISYTVSRTGATGAAATIQFDTVGGTAKAGSDYTAITGQTLSFAAGETSKTVQVAVTDDALAESSETVIASLSNASAGSITTATASATITDNDTTTWSVSTANVSEDAGFISYTVSRTGGAGVAATIRLDAANGSATAGSDYTAVVGQTLSFAAGETSKTVLVAVIDDAQVEGSETVIASLSNASAGSIATATASASITDNDTMNWSVSTATVSEDAGFISYTVSRTGATGAAATIRFDTANGSAIAGSDYTAITGQTLSFAAGETSKTVLVAVTDDVLLEGSETVIGFLSNASIGGITTATASASIADNDLASWSVSTANVSEDAGFISYTVSRTGATGAAATIQFDTAGGSATAGGDYTAVHQTLSFAAGETSKTVLVALVDDAFSEISETVIASLSNAGNPSTSSITTTTASATITDNDLASWSVSTANVSESAGFISYTVSRTGATGAAATIQFDTAGGTATAISDYTVVTGRILSFAAGETSKTVQVAVIDDALVESSETVIGSLSNASTGSITTATATATITDTDTASWGVTAATVSEDAGFITYVITRTAGAAATINFDTLGGTAKAGSDYTAVHQILSFAAGETRKIVLVPLTDDAVAEGDETMTGSINNASAGVIQSLTTTATITDNDTTTWSVSTATVSEDAGFISYTVSRTGATGAAATIQFDTAGGTATAGSDYTAVHQILSFAAGETSKTVLVAVTDDALVEGSETVTGYLSGASAGSITTATASATITDNDTMSWSVSTAGVSEGAGFISYTVSRAGATGAAATIQFDTLNGSAKAGSDHMALTGQTLSFAAGETSKTVLVTLTDDALLENSETVFASLSNASAGSIATATASATITDNDTMSWSVSTAGASEGAGFISYTVSRTGATGAAATIRFDTAGGTATAGSDYTAVTGQTLSFAAGETSKTVLVAVTDDALIESSETVTGSLSNASAGNITTATASTSITDNDQVIWSVSNASGSETAGFISYTVSRAGATGAAATIQFDTVDVTAQAGSDYTAVSQTLSFAADETSKTVLVAVIDDVAVEGNETVIGSLSNASTGTITTVTTTATITDNDPVNWSVSTNGVSEAAGFISYVVSRTGGGAATIQFDTSDNGATAGSDYTAVHQTLSFAAGEISKTVLVAVADDALAEGNEAVTGSLSSASAGSIATATASATITDNDQSIWSVSTANGSETAGFISYTVSRAGATGAAATIQFDTADGTATIAGGDYTAVTGQTLSFAAGETSKIVLVAVTDDVAVESNETVTGSLSNASTGSIATATVNATIADNDTGITDTDFSTPSWVLAGASTTPECTGFVYFTVTRTGGTGLAATIQFDTSDNTATIANNDYTAVHQTLSFAAGEAKKVVMVPVIDDATPESGETVRGTLSNASIGSITTATANGTIVDDDSLTWGVSTATVSENAGFISYTVSRTGATDAAATIRFDTVDGSAQAGSDYTAVSQTLSFAAGETSKIVLVAVTDDTDVETSETVTGSLSNASVGSITTATINATITDNDQAQTTSWSVSTPSTVSEGAGVISYTVSRTGLTDAAATIQFDTSSTGATAGSDFTTVTGRTLSFAAGETSKTVLVEVIDDTAVEAGTETVTGNLSNASTGTIATATASTTITDNDTAASYSIATISSTAYEAGGVAGFVITRSGNTTNTDTSYFRINGGTATVGSDYTDISGQTLSWGVNETTKTVMVALSNDAFAEGSETVIGQSATDVAFTTGSTTSTFTIKDDDTYIATAGVMDTLTTGTSSGGYLGGDLLNTGDMDDAVTIGSNLSGSAILVDLGSGNDALNATDPSNLLISGAQYIGGIGVDTLALSGTTTFDLRPTSTVGNLLKGFEIISMAASGNQTLKLNLTNVLELTSGNAVPDTLRITGSTGDILNLQALGRTILDPGSSINDVDGTSYTVVASAVGNSSAKDVDIGGVTYDVFQYAQGGHTLNLLVNTQITTNVI